jgi:hypothetical protein
MALIKSNVEKCWVVMNVTALPDHRKFSCNGMCSEVKLWLLSEESYETMCPIWTFLFIVMFVHCRNPSRSRQPGKLSWCDRGWHGSCNWFMGQLPENLELKDP